LIDAVWSLHAWRVVDVLLALAAIPCVVMTGYLAVLAMFARRPGIPMTPNAPVTRFAIVVPAHDEELGIARTVASIAAVDYPASLRRIIVVADNCSDTTADCSRAAGAEVLERDDTERRGKGYALSYAFDTILQAGNVDAVAVVDADTSIAGNLLRAFDREIVAGHATLQAHYDVRDAAESWRTRLASLALVLFHGVRSLGREALGVSCGLRGNGMCFSVAQLRAVPHAAFSLVEDLEYGIALGLAGIRVRYVADAAVRGDMPVSSAASRTQRARWEGGRRAIRRQYAASLLRRAVRERSPLLLDLAIDLLVPPLTTVFVLLAAGTTMAVAVCIMARETWSLSLLAWGVADAGFLLYVARGCVMTGHFWRAVRDLAWAPVFMLWKLSVRAAAGVAGEEWVRTSRTTMRKGDG